MYFEMCKKIRQKNYRYLDLYIHIYFMKILCLLFLGFYFFITTIELYKTKQM